MNKNNIITLALLIVSFTVIMVSGCGGNSNQTPKENEPSETSVPPVTEPVADDGKGIGEIKNVELTTPLNGEMVTRGEAIYDMKCAACHKLDESRVVGPGWKGVTERRKPEWIMNFVTNVDIMLDKDPAAQKLLEECLTRMPNQNISIGDARDILEFMRRNDGVK